MSELDQAKVDVFGLAGAAIPDLVSHLERELPPSSDEQGSTPLLAEQLAGLILAESIRLIRMGTSAEIAGSSKVLARLLIQPATDELERTHPEIHELLLAASVSLAAATPADSRGGARTILRSWGGKAKEVVERLQEAPRDSLRRKELRERVGITDESHFSHLLADLEAARLIARVREGREVIVRLAVAARSDEAREAMGQPESIFRIKQEPDAAALGISAERNRLGPERQEPALLHLEPLPPHYENESFVAGSTRETLTICNLVSPAKGELMGASTSALAYTRALERSSLS